jgi:hypothetical protein
MIDDAKPEEPAVKSAEPAVNGVEPEWPKKLKLRKAVSANGESVMELSFREPTVNDLERCGDPARVDFFKGEPQVVYNNDAVTAMLSTLAAVPPSTIKNLAIKDWKNARLLITVPFLEDLFL